MTDPIFKPQDFLNAEFVVDHLLQNLAIDFQVGGDQFSREKMVAHVEKRKALLRTKLLLIDEAERIFTEGKA